MFDATLSLEHPQGAAPSKEVNSGLPQVKRLPSEEFEIFIDEHPDIVIIPWFSWREVDGDTPTANSGVGPCVILYFIFEEGKTITGHFQNHSQRRIDEARVPDVTKLSNQAQKMINFDKESLVKNVTSRTLIDDLTITPQLVYAKYQEMWERVREVASQTHQLPEVYIFGQHFYPEDDLAKMNDYSTQSELNKEVARSRLETIQNRQDQDRDVQTIGIPVNKIHDYRAPNVLSTPMIDNVVYDPVTKTLYLNRR